MNKFTLYLILSAVLIIGAMGIYGYVWYSETTTLVEDAVKEAEVSTEKAARYDKLEKAILEERVGCLEFMAKESGNFARFNYCEGFVEWATNQFDSL